VGKKAVCLSEEIPWVLMVLLEAAKLINQLKTKLSYRSVGSATVPSHIKSCLTPSDHVGAFFADHEDGRPRRAAFSPLPAVIVLAGVLER
jgi:hypothetical protein